MKPTIEYIENKFREFNHLLFDDKLPILPIQLSNAKTFLGMLVYKKKRKLFGKMELYDFRLRISIRLDLPEREVEDTIIHEMIHYYLYYTGEDVKVKHGKAFKRKANEMNRAYGLNISQYVDISSMKPRKGAPLLSRLWYKIIN